MSLGMSLGMNLGMNLSGQTALVSGSSRGIGKGIAMALLEAGARVCLNGRNEEAVACAADELITKTGSKAVGWVAADLTTTDGVISALDQVEARLGEAPRIVVPNIGSGRSVAGWDVNDAEWQRMLDLNLHGAIRLTREAIRRMNDGGSITAVASIAGCESIGAPVPYTVAKAALLAFVKATADEVARDGIRVNAVSPGNVFFDGGTWGHKLASDRDGVLAMIEQKVPMNGFAACADIGNAVAYLASDQARFITGANLVVDGGQLRGLHG